MEIHRLMGLSSPRRRPAKILLFLLYVTGCVFLGAHLTSRYLLYRVRADTNPEASLTVHCYGDSHTYGVGAPSDFSYPLQLSRRLGPQVNVRNFGVPGDRGQQTFGLMRENFASDESLPDFVVLWIGSNQLRSGLRKEFSPLLQEMLLLLEEREVQSLLLTYPNLLYKDVARVNPVLRAAAAQRPWIELLDLEERFLRRFGDDAGDQTALFVMGDGHPSSVGYGHIAEWVQSEMARIGSPRLAKVSHGSEPRSHGFEERFQGRWPPVALETLERHLGRVWYLAELASSSFDSVLGGETSAPLDSSGHQSRLGSFRVIRGDGSRISLGDGEFGPRLVLPPDAETIIESPPFVITRRFLAFRLAGGEGHGSGLYLVEGERILRYAAGLRTFQQNAMCWDVEDLKGQKVSLRLYNAGRAQRTSLQDHSVLEFGSLSPLDNVDLRKGLSTMSPPPPRESMDTNLERSHLPSNGRER